MSAAVSITELSDHNAPYRHFADREALLAALAAQGFEMLGQAMRGQTGRGMGEAYVRFALQYPQRFRLMFAARSRSRSTRGCAPRHRAPSISCRPRFPRMGAMCAAPLRRPGRWCTACAI